jgi:hypothetical protein
MRLLLPLLIGLTLVAQQTDTRSKNLARPDVYVSAGFLQGRDYLALSDDERAAYAAGLFNGMSVAHLIADVSESQVHWLDACSRGMTARQVAEIIRKDIQGSPPEWHFQINLLGLNAMLRACQQYNPPPHRKP